MATLIDRKERDRMLRQAKRMTEQISDAQRQRVNLARERRALLLTLNRDFGVSYKRLQHEVNLSPARLVQEISKAKEEAGITDPHPRYPASFQKNGARR